MTVLLLHPQILRHFNQPNPTPHNRSPPMPLSIHTLHSDDLKEQITLYRPTDYIDIIRNIPRKTLDIIGLFKAAIEENNVTTPADITAQIYSIKRIFLRVSSFYRGDFIKNNYIRHKGQLMRISSTQYNRITGVTCLMCYDVSEF
jgi:hypothetical protein